MAPLLIGIDAGTSSLKVQVIDASGRTVAEAARALDYTETADHGSEFDPDRLWQTTAACLTDALGRLENPHDVAAIACTGVGESGVLVDQDGEVCCTSLAWYDERPVEQMHQLIERYGRKALSRKSGMRVSPIAGLCKLMWMRDHHPEALKRARHWLTVSDFIAFRLSGAAATDFSLAGRTLAVDLIEGCWDTQRLREQGIPDHLMPPLTDNGAVIGTVQADVAAELGLSTACRVVNGGHDHLIGALACGVFGSDAMLDSLGTAEAVMLPIPALIEDGSPTSMGIEQGMLRIAGEPLYFMVGGLHAASASVDWFQSELADSADMEQLCAAANGVPAGAGGVLFLPYLRGVSPPYTQAGSHGAFFNIGTWTDRPHMFRAVLEGLAFDARKIAESLTGLAGRNDLPERVMITGGSSQNELLMRLKANIYERTLDVVELPQSVSLGAALLAGLGAGLFSSWREAVSRAGAATRQVTPDLKQAPLYRTRFAQHYLPTVNGLRSMVELQS